MITWMQQHKKWLVVTLWISVFAFVGAGFVGWGSYDYSKSNSTVAKVGMIEVSMTDVQNEYSSLYGQYQSVYKDKFNAEIAKKLGLEQMAMSRAIQNAKLLSFADELGMLVTDKEVAKNLVKTPQFQKNGKFDKTMYIKALAQNRLNPKDYERNLKKSILLSKTAKIFQSKANANEIKLLNTFFEAEDDVEIFIVDTKQSSIKSDETSMKKYWDKNKNKYKSKSIFEFDSYKIGLIDKTYSKSKMKDFYKNNKNIFRDSSGKVKKYIDVEADIINKLKSKSTKKEALRKYIDLKKSKIQFNSKEKYSIDLLPFGIEDINKIKSTSISKVMKPIKMLDGSYIVLKLIKKIKPEVLSYNDAKNIMKNDYENNLQKEILSSNSKIALNQLNQNNLKMIKLGFVARSSIEKLKDIKGLEDNDGIEFLNSLFASNDKSGIITLRYSNTPKAIVYKIVNQRLGVNKSIDEKSNQMLANAINTMKSELIFTNLIKNLENRYETQVFMK